MNSKGFTIVEVLAVILLVSIAVIVVSFRITSSVAIDKEKAYSLMKNNLISVSYNYIEECQHGLIDCNFSFESNNTFDANILQSSGFFSQLESPIDGKNLGSCLIFSAKKENGVVIVDLEDNCY